MHKVERKADTKAWPEASICSELEDHLERGVTVLLSMDDGMERTVFHRGGAAHVHELCQALQQQYTAIEGAVTDAQNQKLGWQQALAEFEKDCRTSGHLDGWRQRRRERGEYVSRANLLWLRLTCCNFKSFSSRYKPAGLCIRKEEWTHIASLRSRRQGRTKSQCTKS